MSPGPNTTAGVPDSASGAACGSEKSSARPGSRAPHVRLTRGHEQISTVDLFGPHFVLLAGRCAAG